MKSAEFILLPIQRAQQDHDLLAHRDILNLDTQTRLKHMTLHFLKYAGKIAIARNERNFLLLEKTLLDAFIICLATANALNVNLAKTWDMAANSLQELAAEIAKASAFDNIEDKFDFCLVQLTVIAGQMAKSVESTDHLERGNPRAELEELIVKLSSVILGLLGAINIPVEKSLVDRWKSVEAKSIFYCAPDAS